jgi:putative transposase
MNKDKKLSQFDVNKDITILKTLPDTDWLNSIDSIALQNASADLAQAYENFFNSITGKRKGPKLSAPKFKSRYDRQSYRTTGVKVNFEDNLIKLPKMKWMKASIRRSFDGKIKSSTISKNASGQYYISILVEEEINLLPQTGIEIGIDLGIKDLAILSNGIKFHSPIKLFAKAKQKLKKEQRKLSRKAKGSNNRTKQRLKVAKAYQDISNARNSYYHEISNYLVTNYDAIYMESLNVKGMLQNRKLSRVIHESSWSTLVNMISYKCAFYGKTFHQIGRFVPSSKTCSCCDHKLDSLDLSIREWTCPSCGTNHDRDLNAAQNIKNFGQLDCYDQILTSNAIVEEELKIPKALMKRTSKIERSKISLVSSGMEQDTRSLDEY